MQETKEPLDRNDPHLVNTIRQLVKLIGAQRVIAIVHQIEKELYDHQH